MRNILGAQRFIKLRVYRINQYEVGLMRCVQSGCELTVDLLMESGHIPVHCPHCQHPLAFVLDRGEAADLFGVPLEETEDAQDPLPLRDNQEH